MISRDSVETSKSIPKSSRIKLTEQTMKEMMAFKRGSSLKNKDETLKRG